VMIPVLEFMESFSIDSVVMLTEVRGGHTDKLVIPDPLEVITHQLPNIAEEEPSLHLLAFSPIIGGCQSGPVILCHLYNSRHIKLGVIGEVELKRPTSLT